MRNYTNNTGTTVVEIGFEITKEQLQTLEGIYELLRIPYYIEPPRNLPFVSLEDLECQCEGK